MKFYGTPGDIVRIDGIKIGSFDRLGVIESEEAFVIETLSGLGYKSDRPGEAVYRSAAKHNEPEGAAIVKVLCDAITGQDGKVTRKGKGE
jgi:hypothetical protein